VTEIVDLFDEEQYTGLRKSIRNIVFPPKCTEVGVNMWSGYKDLEFAFPNGDNDTITEALSNRFEGLSFHKTCYYQSYHDNKTTLQNLKRKINQLNVSGKQRDCLGMTSLHILACSTNPTIEMYRLLIDKFPETLIMKDKWGDIPLLYAVWCNASTEVLDLLVKSYKTLHPDYEINWKDMLLTLTKANVPLANIQRLINAQQSSFSNQKYDIQAIVMKLAIYDTSQASLRKPFTSVDIVQYLLQISISKRLDSLGISKWRKDLENCIKSLPDKAKNREDDTKAVYDRLVVYESIKEGTSVLELALWKAKIDNSSRNKRAKVDGEVSYRDQCRVNSGADIVIRNVLPYLVSK